MLRGEFRRADGLVIPNNVTLFGAKTVLELALKNVDVGFSVGLCAGVYTPDLQIEDLDEPTIGTGGYGRIGISRDVTGWPTPGELNGTPFLESKSLIWTPTGTGFDKAISRMFLTTVGDATSGDVFAISASLPIPVIMTVDTLEADRTFKYRLYLR